MACALVTWCWWKLREEKLSLGEHRQLSNQPQRPERAAGQGSECAAPPPSLLPAGCPAGRGSAWTMPILLFLIDTSASMNQRAYLGTSYLDIAKGAVEIFMKVSAGPGGTAAPPAPFARSRRFSPLSPQLRARDPASRGDRYMLVTFDEPPYCIKVILPPRGCPGPPAAAPAPPRGRPWRGGGAAPSGPAAAAAACEDGGHFAFVWRREAEGAAEMEEGGTDGSVIHRPGVPRGAGGWLRSASRPVARPPPVRRWLRRGLRLGLSPGARVPAPLAADLSPVSGGCVSDGLRGHGVGREAAPPPRLRDPRPAAGAGEPPAAFPPPSAGLCFLGQRCQELLTASARQEAAASVGVGGSPHSFLRL